MPLPPAAAGVHLWVGFLALVATRVTVAGAGEEVLCSAALLAAAEHGEMEELRARVEAESWSCVDRQQKTPLHLAVQSNHVNATLFLLAAGALSRQDELGRTPLHGAVIEGHLSLAELLLDAGAYIELQDNAGRTPLHHAARQGHVHLVSMLLDRGASIFAADRDQRTALHYSSRSDVFLNTTRLLCDHGAPLEAVDVIGFQALHFACYENQRRTVDFLLGLGADLYALDLAGWNPLVHAAAQGHIVLVDSLVVRMLRPDTLMPEDTKLLGRATRMAGIAGLPISPLPVWALLCVTSLTAASGAS